LRRRSNTKIVLQVIDWRATLFGLSAPTRVQVDPELSDREFAERAAELITSSREGDSL
jgi:hypothetical protein